MNNDMMEKAKGIAWYKDRDYPEIKSGNDDIVAVVPAIEDRDRIIREHNDLIMQLTQLRAEISSLRSEVAGLKTARDEARINQKALLNYRCGNWPYDFSKIPPDQRDNESFDALLKIEAGMADWLSRYSADKGDGK